MKLIFKRTRPEAGGALTFIFAPTEPLVWVAGQSIKIEVTGAYGPVEHRFTISSAPFEGEVAITTRLSTSSFKKGLAKLLPGDTIHAYAVEGDVTWRKTELPRVFVAAGIGITPFYSMLKQRVHNELPIAVTLLYNSSTPDIIFKPQLDAWSNSHPELHVRYVVGERLNATHINAVADVTKSLLYLSGPSEMVDDLSAQLMSLGAPEANLIRDWFTGRLPAEG